MFQHCNRILRRLLVDLHFCVLFGYFSIFDSTNNDLENSKVPSADDFKNKPDGWETTAKAQEGSVWEMTQREEDILLQEFERRIAYNKFQV